jgi:predicted ABC-type sugar transport system permease subunit
VLAGRVSTSIPYVRDQVARLHGRDPDARIVVAGDVAALLLVGGAALVDGAAALGALAVLAVVVAQRVEAARLPAPRAVVLGIRQTVVGLVVVLATAAGTWAA